ncbi:aldo/keto reductase [Marinicrinis sediminis]|uniref:Aldo/keto reductase family oxidoreductase n=1 Tax=Marinicrinis sediminis TaxID=1652465 RepID=A0ABW5R4S8_9BACL
MKKLPIHRRGIEISPLSLGCMGFGGGWNTGSVTDEHVMEAQQALETSIEHGITFLDHADIYTFGKAEETFGRLLTEKPQWREQLWIQSKCGIRFEESATVPGRYDFDRNYIVKSVEGILSRLKVDYLDSLLLHRPDPLMDPEEVAEAISQLKSAGKVKYFGVSNMSRGQIELLQAYSEEPLIFNQLEMSLAKLDFLETGVLVNHPDGKYLQFPEGTMEYCRLQNIQLQAWGSLAQGLFSGRSVDDQPEAIRATAKRVSELALEKDCSREAIVLAWLMKHPAGIQPIIGTTNPERIAACSQAVDVTLSREEWYSLYVSARGKNMP